MAQARVRVQVLVLGVEVDGTDGNAHKIEPKNGIKKGKIMND